MMSLINLAAIILGFSSAAIGLGGGDMEQAPAILQSMQATDIHHIRETIKDSIATLQDTPAGKRVVECLDKAIAAEDMTERQLRAMIKMAVFEVFLPYAQKAFSYSFRQQSMREAGESHTLEGEKEKEAPRKSLWASAKDTFFRYELHIQGTLWAMLAAWWVYIYLYVR